MAMLMKKKFLNRYLGNKYNNLYSEDDMHSIKQEINDRLNISNEIYKVDFHDMIKAVHKLKDGKFDGKQGLNSEHIINGPHLLIIINMCVLIVCLYMLLPLTVCWRAPWCQSLKVTYLY